MNSATEESAVITLTDPAVEHVKSLLASDPANQGKCLRLYIENGGCSGMQYSMTFDEKRPDDTIVEFDDLAVLVDAFSLPYLRGATVDYSDALTGGGFKISNPNARQSCGCGKSFEA